MAQSIIIIPCYNEEKRLNVNAFVDFADKNPDVAIWFVNDGSKDNTSFILDRMAYENKNIKVIHLEKNGGKGPAIRSGIQSTRNTDASIIGFLDADLATPLAEGKRLIDILQHQKDIKAVFGSRVKLKRNSKRALFSRIFSGVVNMFIKINIDDTQCGAKFFKSAWVYQLFDAPFKTQWLFDVELILRALNENNNGIQDIPVREIYLRQWDEIDHSKLKINDFYRIAFEFIKVIWNYKVKKYKKPVAEPYQPETIL